MSNFENFYQDLIDLAQKYELKNTALKIEKDFDNEVIKIFGEKISSLERAKNGLNDILELGYATAEHHPYWKLLSSCSEITSVVLEKWNESISSEDLSDVEWNLKEFHQSLENIKTKFSNTM